MSDKISDNLLVDLAKLCLLSADTTGVIKTHFQYSFTKVQQYKELFRYIFDYHTAKGKTPTIGILSENLPQTPEMMRVIGQVREAAVHDKKDLLMIEFEKFIKKGRFMKMSIDVKELYDKQEHEKAFELSQRESKAINDFSLLAELPSRVFADFDKRQTERKVKDFTRHKWPTGIPPFDHHTFGGVEPGRALLVIARKGVGKSTFLRWIGFNLAFRGKTGIHFQAEGTKEEVQDAYDAMWTGIPMDDIKKGELTGKDIQKIESARKSFLAQSGEIIIVPYEQFASATIADCRNHIIELKKHYNIEWAVFDYLEKFDPGDGKRYGTNDESNRSKKLAVAEKIVNIATEFRMFTATGTQANDIDPKQYNDPNFVITRSNIANLRATIDPFAYTVTLNQTDDENDRDVIRMHEEAFRFQKIKSWESTYHIAQKRDVGRFIDVAETNLRYWDPVLKKVIKNTPKVK